VTTFAPLLSRLRSSPVCVFRLRAVYIKPLAIGSGRSPFYIYFIRSNNGDANAHLFQGAKFVETSSRAAWDDAIPWGPGTYELESRVHPVSSGEHHG